jgi:regulator of ribonuclease activity A
LRFAGPVRTVKCVDDNSKVRATLETSGNGAVLVVDGGGSMRCALLGDQLATLAIENGWAGVVVNGCIRDSEVIDGMPIGIKALATCPRKSAKRGRGDVDVPLQFAGIVVRPGDTLCADADGWIVTATC